MNDIGNNICNIRAYYLLSTQNEKVVGLSWYRNARNACTRLAKIYSLPLSVVVGILAALSPRNKWIRNVSDTEQLILLGSSATVSTFNSNKDKALRILNGEPPLDVLSGNKVISFYKCVNFLGTDEVCVDSHALGVAKGNGERLKSRHVTDSDYFTIVKAYQEVASVLEIEPKQLQAITWLTYRRIHTIH